MEETLTYKSFDDGSWQYKLSVSGLLGNLYPVFSELWN